MDVHLMSIRREAVEHKSGYDRVVAFLREELLSGALKTGDCLLPERELAAQLGVGRPVLREALRALAMIGALEIRHGVGTIVKKPDVSTLGEFFTFVLAQQADAIDDIMEARVAIEEEDDDLFIAVNQAFHHVVLASMGSKTLGDTMDQLDAFLRLATLPILERDPAFNRRFIEVNEHIVELVQSGDRQAASDYLQVQLMEQAEAIIEMIEKINNGAV